MSENKFFIYPGLRKGFLGIRNLAIKRNPLDCSKNVGIELKNLIETNENVEVANVEMVASERLGSKMGEV